MSQIIIGDDDKLTFTQWVINVEIERAKNNPEQAKKFIDALKNHENFILAGIMDCFENLVISACMSGEFKHGIMIYDTDAHSKEILEGLKKAFLQSQPETN